MPGGLGLGLGVNKGVLMGGSPSPSYPAIMDNAAAWYDYLNEDNVVDGSDRVSNFKDKNSEDNDLLQADGGKQPLMTENGVLFNGLDENMKTALFTWQKPAFIMLCFRQVTWTSLRRAFEANNTNVAALLQYDTTPSLMAFDGSPFPANNNNLALNTFGIAKVYFTDTAKELEINETGNVSTAGTDANDLDAFVLGGRTTGDYSNIEAKAGILFRAKPTAQEIDDIYDYWNSYYSLGL